VAYEASDGAESGRDNDDGGDDDDDGSASPLAAGRLNDDANSEADDGDKDGVDDDDDDDDEDEDEDDDDDADTASWNTALAGLLSDFRTTVTCSGASPAADRCVWDADLG